MDWDWTEGLHRFTSHLFPTSDLIEHDLDSDGDCVCGPVVEPVPRDEHGGFGWMYLHSSLDGRELVGGTARGQLR